MKGETNLTHFKWDTIYTYGNALKRWRWRGRLLNPPRRPRSLQQLRVQTKLTVACFKAESSPNTGAERGCCCPAELCPKLHFQAEYVKRFPTPDPPSNLQTALLLSTNHLTSFRFLLVWSFFCCWWWWVFFFSKKRNSAGSLRPRRSRAPVSRRPGDEAFERFVSMIFFFPCPPFRAIQTANRCPGAAFVSLNRSLLPSASAPPAA